MFASKERMLNNAARKMIECSRQRIKQAFKKWHSLGSITKNKYVSIKLIQMMMYKTKIGKVLEAWSKWKGLPTNRLSKKY